MSNSCTVPQSLLGEIVAELERATQLHPEWSNDPIHIHAVLNEECGELGREILQMVYEPHRSSPDKIRAEAIQTAAMALRLLLNLERMDFRSARVGSLLVPRLRQFLAELETEDLPTGEPAESVFLGRQQVADKLRLLLAEIDSPAHQAAFDRTASE